MRSSLILLAKISRYAVLLAVAPNCWTDRCAVQSQDIFGNTASAYGNVSAEPQIKKIFQCHGAFLGRCAPKQENQAQKKHWAQLELLPVPPKLTFSFFFARYQDIQWSDPIAKSATCRVLFARDMDPEDDRRASRTNSSRRGWLEVVTDMASGNLKESAPDSPSVPTDGSAGSTTSDRPCTPPSAAKRRRAAKEEGGRPVALKLYA